MCSRIRAARERRGWSQHELASRAGVTRQLVGAVEAGRHAPNVVAAMSLARALGASVEDLFADEAEPIGVFDEAAAPGTSVRTARVGDTLVAVPVPHQAVDPEQWDLVDAVVTESGIDRMPGAGTNGLVLAGCDPLIGMLAGLVERASPHRVLPAHASTGRSIQALRAGRVHAVVVHATAGAPPPSPVPVRRWHLARWQVGMASSPGSGPPPIEELAERRTSVVQREPGAGTQQALQRALANVGAPVELPGPLATGHLDVARRITSGGAEIGVTMEAAAQAFGLGFTPLEEHAVELWIDERWAILPAAVALIETLTSTPFLARATRLRGYDLAGCGDERRPARR